MKKLSIIGSTGSIGRTTLDVVSHHKNEFKVLALAAKENISLLEKQARIFRPRVIAVWDEEKAQLLRKKLSALRIKVVNGEEGLREVARITQCNQVVFALSGMKGLRPLLDAIRAKKDIAIANKEPLVIAGPLIKDAIRRSNVKFIPIDSEHSAIFQCLAGSKREYVKKIIITASGGPFIDYPDHLLRTVTIEKALRHPRWKMGKKITIDSATMMNKGLEVIEAMNLYDIDLKRIEILIHRESIIHSLVEYIDGSVIAQLSTTDMCFPIVYALTYPERLQNNFSRLDLAKIKTLSFKKPDYKKFPCIRLAYQAGACGGTMPAVLNAANEVAVEQFLNKKIAFHSIATIIQSVMKKHKIIQTPTIDTIITVDRWAREEAEKLC
ncbi:MAG: 1-deoxy-D-xylulose-5-phosphate reductoisomerase [Candidatus Omnitrophica bacterium]|nr:1-deoxy-D-xylulose-5-phosphate reductoisomerase [Candidatus Omnitrophota bacterium]